MTSSARFSWIRWFEEIGIEDIALVGGKNASLGEMIRELVPRGIKVPNGFAVAAEAAPLSQVGGVARIQAGEDLLDSPLEIGGAQEVPSIGSSPCGSSP